MSKADRKRNNRRKRETRGRERQEEEKREKEKREGPVPVKKLFSTNPLASGCLLPTSK